MCPETTQDEMNAAAKSASEAFKTWKESSVLTRQAIMLKYQQKIKDNAVNLQYTVAYHDLGITFTLFCLLPAKFLKYSFFFWFSLKLFRGYWLNWSTFFPLLFISRIFLLKVSHLKMEKQLRMHMEVFCVGYVRNI